MGNKNYKSSNKAKIVKNGLFKERRYKPNQLFARLKQKSEKQFLENCKNWKFKLRRA